MPLLGHAFWPADRNALRFQRAEREFQTHLSGLGLRFFRNPLVFSPSFQKEGMREAPPRANEPIVRSAKAQEHAPPTRLLPLRRSPSSQSADQQTVLAVKPAGHSAGAPVASGPEYLPIRCRQVRGNRLLLHRDHRHELDPFRGTGWGERIENIFPSVNSKFLSETCC